MAMMFYDDPGLMEDVLDTLCDFMIGYYSRIHADIPIDLFFIWEDMCDKNGPLCSPAMFRRFLLPRYQRFIGAMRGRGVDVSNVVEGSRRTPAGLELKWKAATLGAQNPLPLVFVEHLTPVEMRRTQVPGAGAHPNGATVVRTAWLYGAGGPSFVATMLAKARAGDPVSVVTDQIGQPTWTRDLAERIRLLLDVPPGVYHGTNSGACSWWDLAVAIYEEVGASTTLVSQTTSDAFVRPAPRPAYSVLGDDAARVAGLPEMPPWRDALHKALRADFSV
jgi:hypothetical protein